jgi:hypothetical protein
MRLVSASRDVRSSPKADIRFQRSICRDGSFSASFTAANRRRRSITSSAACGARKGPLEFRHPHFGFNRVGNETILMGGMMHLIELFRTGLLVAAPRDLWT